MDSCRLCPRRCGADRVKTLGVCRAPREVVVRAALPLFYEEPQISGTRGSGTVFFAGCPLHCVYCQNRAISESAESGKKRSAVELAEIFERLERTGVHNLNLVTPTHYADRIAEAFCLYRPKIPVVWNTSGYETVETVVAVSEFVDVFLTDFKYADPTLAKRYSRAEDYPQVAQNAIDRMVELKTLSYGAGDEAGLLKRGVIVRHLVLPGARENTKRAAELFAARWKDRAVFSLMGQYTPNGSEREEVLKRPLRPIEYRIAVRDAEQAGLNDFMIQETGAAGLEYVPNFDMD